MDAGLIRSSISAGLLVYKLLDDSKVVKERSTTIFPVCITDDEAQLPYVVFRFASQDPEQVKPKGGPDTCTLVVDCLGDTYGDAVNLAEAVRYTLDDAECAVDGLELSGCVMTDREEFWESDAYVERLIFTITI